MHADVKICAAGPANKFGLLTSDRAKSMDIPFSSVVDSTRPTGSRPMVSRTGAGSLKCAWPNDPEGGRALMKACGSGKAPIGPKKGLIQPRLRLRCKSFKKICSFRYKPWLVDPSEIDEGKKKYLSILALYWTILSLKIQEKNKKRA